MKTFSIIITFLNLSFIAFLLYSIKKVVAKNEKSENELISTMKGIVSDQRIISEDIYQNYLKILECQKNISKYVEQIKNLKKEISND